MGVCGKPAAHPGLRQHPAADRGPKHGARRDALPTIEGATIEWLSPLAGTGYVEYQDASFWQAIGEPELATRAAGWWPARGGPCWDALALAHRPEGSSTLVLVEAKAHVAEFGPAPVRRDR